MENMRLYTTYEVSFMVFTRLHWCLTFLITLFASIVFFLFYTSLEEGKVIMLGCSVLTGIYALFSLYKICTYRRYHILQEEVLEYKTSCPFCGELLCGHEISCPKCGSFLPKNMSLMDEEEENN